MAEKTRTFNAYDVDRIRDLLDLAGSSDAVKAPAVLQLRRDVSGSSVVSPSEVPADVVTLNTELLLDGYTNDGPVVVTLVFPREADMGQRRISLFSPLGAALLGRRRGETVRYAAPGGEIEVRILDIVYQPEAAGRYDV
jgi:regulator of nucleoside diphosphate kinase